MVHTYTKYSVSLLIREIQSKTMMRYVCTPIRMPKTRKNGDHQLLARMLSDRDRPSLSEGMQNRVVSYTSPVIQQPRSQVHTREK